MGRKAYTTILPTRRNASHAAEVFSAEQADTHNAPQAIDASAWEEAEEYQAPIGSFCEALEAYADCDAYSYGSEH